MGRFSSATSHTKLSTYQPATQDPMAFRDQDPFNMLEFDPTAFDPTALDLTQAEFPSTNHAADDQDFAFDQPFSGAMQHGFDGTLPFFDPTLSLDAFSAIQNQLPWPDNTMLDMSSQSATPGSLRTDSRPETPGLPAAHASSSSALPPKVGTRFSRESLKILRNWLSTHSRHPFPTDEERDILERQTGLNKTQILNWLANARRRGKVPEYKTASPRTESPGGKEIPNRRRAGTPAPTSRTPFMNPLERWSCVFCGELDPGIEHMQNHNYTICQGRPLDERTFHRKDHLGQHLRLVHNLKPAQLVRQLSEWKMESPDVRSTCGFCGLEMTTFAARADHLAEHFKMGTTMANWKGDWGLDPHILSRLENAMAPYLIALERNSPYPFSACNAPLESPINAYELIKLELMNFIDICYDKTGRIPSPAELQSDACRIIFAAEVPSYHGDECSSWLRDLILSADDIVQKAKLSPLRSAKESRLTFLHIIGKKSPFESCPLEAQLLDFVQSQPPESLTESRVHRQAVDILRKMESASSSPSDIATTWLLELARSSKSWLKRFQLRAGVNLSETAQFEVTPTPIDQVLQNYEQLESKLAERVELLRQHGIEPDDTALRQQALKIIDEFDNAEWRTLAASNHGWLARFKRRHLPWADSYGFYARISGTANQVSSHNDQTMSDGNKSPHRPGLIKMKIGEYYLNDPNFDKWVARELARWVAATMSPNNPNQHVPTDEELKHQARWIMYEDFNTTMADSDEWLQRFKRDAKILHDQGPGLLTELQNV
ncbi:Homeobox protein-like protein [Emericellopsis cladophorae]|uniref:Homeobox protein-like protein n=1 Tax=Emericellopsis cladophorae TaxID=2686198 RepID=A0A9P9XU69_9HYPO|nr:Homeobox protein-like protein [Emericellopsis cladophorae]KAI6777883.1 Homeobox protein-like protein [Emericellopsis cladophorae]